MTFETVYNPASVQLRITSKPIDPPEPVDNCVESLEQDRDSASRSSATSRS